MRLHSLRVSAALLVAAAVVAGPALLSGGRALAGTPTSEVRGFLARAVSIAENVELAPRERLHSVHRMFADAFDFRGAAELALGQHWRARTPAERREFVPLFADLLERSYVSQIKARVKLDGGVKIDYLGESVKGHYATVQTVVRREGREDVPFDYRMIRRGTRWLVHDVVIDGVSLVGNYRAQFAKTMEGSSFRQLIVTMKTGEPAR
jgi:phospholipid transport system substrate-binding protein